MSDEHMKLGIELDVHASGEELITRLNSGLKTMDARLRSITAQMRGAASGIHSSGRGSSTGTDAKAETKAKQTGLALDRASFSEFKRKMTFQTRMASQHAREERESLRAYRDRVAFQSRATAKAEREEARAVQTRMRDEAQAFRQRFAFGTRIGRQAVAEERARAREQERSIASAARSESQRIRERAAELRQTQRQELAATRAHEREISLHESRRRRGYADLRQGGGDVRQGVSRATTGAGFITAAGTAAAGSAARRGISTRMEVDTAETNLKIFSGQTAEQIKSARNSFLDNEAIRNGLGIKGGLDAYSEVLKTGMASPAENTKTIMRAVSALELDLKDTTKLAGLIDRNYGSSSTPAKIKSALNAIAVAAREDPTQSGEIVEGVKRSFGALSTGNLTPEQLTAMVSGGQSVGIQPGKAGTFVATMAKQLSMGSSKFLGKKNRAELDFAARELGFGNSRSMAQKYATDSYSTMMSVHENLNKMEAAKRTQVSEALYGRQWSDEGLQMAQGAGGVRKTYGEISDRKNSNFLDEAARQRSESLQGQWNSTKSIFNRFLDAFGSGFEDILTSINKYFLDLNSSFDYDKVKTYVVSFFDGVKDALGVKTWTELLQNTFGGNLGNYGQQIREFARGFTDGVLSIVRAIRSVFSAFAGSNASAEQIGNWTGKFLAFAAACIVSAPAIAVLTGLATAIAGLATVALGAWRILRAAGVVGAAGLGSAPKTPTSAPGSGAVGRLGGLGIANAAAGFAGSYSLSKGEQDSLSNRLGKWAQDREKATAPARPVVDVPPKAVEELKSAIEDNTLIHKQSFEAESGFKGLIHKASLATVSPGDAVRSSIQATAHSVMSGTLGNGVGVSSGGPLSNSTPGSALGQTGLGGRGIIGGRRATPGSGFGGGSVPVGVGGGSASSNPANSAASARMLDAIAGTESGKAGYDAVLGNGKYGTPSKPISQMTIDEAYAFGRQVRARHGSSSALGRYQIVGQTMRGAQAALGIPGSAPFNPEMQDRMARWIARRQGLGAWEGLKHNPRAMAEARLAMNQGGALDTGGSTGKSSGAAIPGLGGGSGQYAGLRYKGQQAIGGGNAHVGVTDLARQAQADLPGGVKHFSAFNDHFHKGRRSKHNEGLAFDTSLLDPSKSVAAAEGMRAKLRTAGLTDKDFKVIDEYKNPSGHSTGGHIHSQFNTPEAAKKYQEYIAKQNSQSNTVAKQIVPPSIAAAQGSSPTVAAIKSQEKVQSAKAQSQPINPADIAQKYVGMHEVKDNAALKGFVGAEVTGDVNAWCARFVNSSLKAAGIQGTNSPFASSFQKWGTAVDDISKITRGDVLYSHKGKTIAPGLPGGHAAIATGQTRKNESGETEVEAYSGNSEDKVNQRWYKASEVNGRRAPGLGSQAPIGSQTPLGGQTPLGASAPMRAPNTQPSQASLGGGMGGGGGGIGGSPISITMNHQGNDPQAIANAVQRRLQDSMNRRSHDLDPSSISGIG